MSLIVIVALPFWALIALAIKLYSRGPGPLLRPAGRRWASSEFQMLKFRTMVEGAERQQAALEQTNEASGALFKIRDDPRVTPSGASCAASRSTRSRT